MRELKGGNKISELFLFQDGGLEPNIHQAECHVALEDPSTPASPPGPLLNQLLQHMEPSRVP